MERLDFRDFKVSMKSTSVPNTIASNRLLAERIPYPLHLGVTEAGTKWSGSLKSAVGLGTLLADGIGDTIRISLSTFHAEEEVKVAWEILKALKLRERGPVLIACPTCGRLQFDMDSVVAEVERRLEDYDDPIEVSVLGCAVNGIGEARHADFGITGAKDAGAIYSKGEMIRKVRTENLVDELFAEIDKYYAAGKKVIRDEAAAAEARAWLAENEDATAMTPERLAAMEAAAARDNVALDEAASPVAGRRFTRAPAPMRRDGRCCPSSGQYLPQSLARSAGRAEQLGDLVPVDDVPERVDVVRTPVLVLEVVGVLPDVDAQQGGLAVRDRAVLVGGRDQGESGAVVHQPRPAGAELVDAAVLELGLESRRRSRRPSRSPAPSAPPGWPPPLGESHSQKSEWL